MDSALTGLTELSRTVTGETPEYRGQAFNLHYQTESSFIKVTQSWVLKERMHTEVATARYLETVGVDATVSLTPEPLSFVDEDGITRWVSFWKRITDQVPLSQTRATRLCLEKLEEFAQLDSPEHFTEFSLDDFVEAVETRLARSDSTFVPFLRGELAAVKDSLPSYDKSRARFIHGDLHIGNLVATSSGRVIVVDLESSCTGPLEWDAAQISRRSLPEDRKTVWSKLERLGLDCDLVRKYHHIRNLTSASHLLLTKVDQDIFEQSIRELQENSWQ